MDALETDAMIETVTQLASITQSLIPIEGDLNQTLIDRHYNRKHGHTARIIK